MYVCVDGYVGVCVGNGYVCMYRTMFTCTEFFINVTLQTNLKIGPVVKLLDS